MAGEKKTERVKGIPGKHTTRQAKFLKALPWCKTITEAAIKAGYSPKSANKGAHQVLKALRGRVPDMMDRLGFSEEEMIDIYLRRGLDATKTVFVREDVVEEKEVGKGKKKSKQEVVRHVVNQYTLNDNMAQLYAMDKAFLLHGSYAPRNRKEAEHFGVKVIVQDVFGTPRPPIDIKPGMAVPELPTPANEKRD